MTPQRKASRFLALAISSVIALSPFVASPADAAPEPPFAIAFPQETQVTVFASTFGAPRSGGRRHTGNDLMAPKMTKVYAAADGIITVIDTSSRGGRYIEIDHGDGWTTRYMHLNNDNPGSDDGSAVWAFTVVSGLKVGSRVEAGQHVAWVGDSGNAEWTGSHTHFEIAYDGQEIDPYLYLKVAFVHAQEQYMAETFDLTPSALHGKL
jgi:murein DD-endopeptidase MepM/ murein hydrolase activator NlpD